MAHKNYNVTVSDTDIPLYQFKKLRLKVSIRLETASTECIETFIWVCRSLMATLVLSTAEGSSPFKYWFISWLHFFLYAIRTFSPDCLQR